MESIVHRTEEAGRELGIQLYVGLQSLVDSLVERAREQRGQTAAEYMGLLLVVSVIVGALATSDIGDNIVKAANSLISKIAGGK